MPAVAIAAVLSASCTSTTGPKAKIAGEVMSLAGVAGLIVTAFAARFTDSNTADVVAGFSLMSAVGIGTYATAELSGPDPGARQETVAAGAARENNCARVRRLESRVRLYDSQVHDFVFMKDVEIQKCMTAEAPVVPRESD